MSSLPPYNPRVGDRAVWLLPLDPGQDPCQLPEGPWSAAVVDGPDLVSVAEMVTGLAPVILRTAGKIEPPASGWLLLVCRPRFAEAALRFLMSMPPGGARFQPRPGTATVVQLLADRAVLLRMSDGSALAGC